MFLFFPFCIFLLIFFFFFFFQLNDLLETINHNIPHPLGNITNLLREAGLTALADKAERQFFEEGKELEDIRTDRSDCQTDDCISKLDVREERIVEEREHRLSLLKRALNTQIVERAATTEPPSDFPERILLIVLMVLLALMVLGLLVLAIALAGYWAKSSKKKEPARLERRPSSEWEWRETY